MKKGVKAKDQENGRDRHGRIEERKKSKLVREREKEEELSSFTSTHRLQEVRAASNRAPSGDKPHPQG